MVEKRVAKLQEKNLIPGGMKSSELREWLLKEGKKEFQDKQRTERHRYLNMIHEEVKRREEKHKFHRIENKRAQDRQRKNVALHKQQEEMEPEITNWKLKEKQLLKRIEEDVKREIKLEERMKKAREERAKKIDLELEEKSCITNLVPFSIETRDQSRNGLPVTTLREQQGRRVFRTDF
nr:PREDICTED: uncharacterized protein KIAA1211 homolog [Latimeria chalumnae]|eukprot:XP_014346307.1 PREDICTED: uncharacterized protein KIAA1211 homolog [Latimeria chalumnae]